MSPTDSPSIQEHSGHVVLPFRVTGRLVTQGICLLRESVLKPLSWIYFYFLSDCTREDSSPLNSPPFQGVNNCGSLLPSIEQASKFK